MELKKISDYEWELPKSGGMKVPARIFATEKLMDKIKLDRTLQQAANVAHLKGIQKYSYVMPDAHEGYGFPIGGVAAFDIEEGVISPGGIGYDINCLTGDAEVLTEFGFRKPIMNFEEDFVTDADYSGQLLLKRFCLLNLISFNKEKKMFLQNKPLFFIKTEPRTVYELATETGLKIKATADHPFLTPFGMKKLIDLKEGDKVALYPFIGVEYEKPAEKMIVDEIQISSKESIIELKKRSLLPFNENSTALPLLAKILGYLMGDGLIYFSKGKGMICAYGSEEDLEEMKNDFDKLGYSGKIYERTRDHQITSQYGTRTFTSKCHELHVSSTSLACLLSSIGMPVGCKTNSKYEVPNWIFSSKKYIKRLFLAGFFGAELTKPKTHTKTGFYSPILGQNKTEESLEAGRKFMIGIMQLLEDLGVKVNKISQRKEFKNKHGETYRLRLIISADEENLLRLYRNIGFEYNQKRKMLGNIAAMYMLRKKELTSKRIEIANKAKELKAKGLTQKEIKELLISKISNDRFIERSLYENAKQRITLDFQSFEAFEKECMAQISEYGTLFDNIAKKRELEEKEAVYDFNVEENHIFIANGFVVSNCGVRLVRTDFTVDQILAKRTQLLNELFSEVPSGVGKGGITKLSKEELLEMLAKGSEWSLEQGYGTKEDLEATEEKGRMKQADPGAVSEKALARGKPQLGTLGSGNHFLEIQKVDEIYDEDAARTLGIEKGKITVMIHCGSRGLGHQVATDYIDEMERKYGFSDLPDRELVNAPINSELGRKYFNAMCSGVNYAFANRQMIVHWVRDSFKKVLGTDERMKQVYDVCHNVAKMEKHKICGEEKTVCVHRKGATRAFGPGHEELIEKYKKIGQPVLIPGTMGTASYVLLGTKAAEEISFASSAHGAGRAMSRTASIRQFRGESIARELMSQGIEIKAASMKGIAEEAVPSYKDIDEVIKTTISAGICKPVAKLKPIGVMKG